MNASVFDREEVLRLIRLALDEDCVDNDITARLSVPREQRGVSRIIAREDLTVCGVPILAQIVSAAGMSCVVSIAAEEGTRLSSMQPLAIITGFTQELLALERTMLNFLQRMCGVATYTDRVCLHAHGLTVLDTRKTMPGWRVLDKYSVRVGGGTNHRFNLSDMILVKNNHVDARAGDMRAVLSDIAAARPEGIALEVEVRTLAEFRTALEFSPDVIMLDNMNNEEIAHCVQLCRDASASVKLEVSGGITAERLAPLSQLGIWAVSMGALTTQAPNVDISMKTEVEGSVRG